MAFWWQSTPLVVFAPSSQFRRVDHFSLRSKTARERVIDFMTGFHRTGFDACEIYGGCGDSPLCRSKQGLDVAAPSSWRCHSCQFT